MTTDAWRGVAAEKADEVSAGLAALLRERSRRLLGDLLRRPQTSEGLSSRCSILPVVLVDDRRTRP